VGKSADGVSILDTMIAEQMAAMGEKPAKATLTALPGERGADTPLPSTPASFPNDQPTEVIIQKIAELTRIITHLGEARDALQLLIGQQPEIITVDVVKAAERAADEKASKRQQVDAALEDTGYSPEKFRALQKKAQDATFTSTGWKCPTHGDDAVIDDQSPKGRKFKRCTVDGCKQFER